MGVIVRTSRFVMLPNSAFGIAIDNALYADARANYDVSWHSYAPLA